MARKHDGLFDQIASFAALHAAAMRAVAGKRKKPGAAAFFANLEAELLRLERELNDQSYRTGRYLEIVVRDPKRRVVSAAPFRDRVVHHALHAVIGPLFERGFIDDSYANRTGKGTHRAVARYEQYRDKLHHVLRADIYRYFPSIDHAVLKQDLRRRVVCERTLWLCDVLVDGSNRQEEVLLHFPGDDLFTPLQRRRGLPMGNLTSQFFANVYLDGLDHFCKEVLRAPYVRYVDDFALFSNDPVQLQVWESRIADYLVKRRLLLHPSKTQIVATAEPAQFLGFVTLADGRRRLPEVNVTRFASRLRSLRKGWCAVGESRGMGRASEVKMAKIDLTRVVKAVAAAGALLLGLQSLSQVLTPIELVTPEEVNADAAQVAKLPAPVVSKAFTPGAPEIMVSARQLRRQS